MERLIAELKDAEFDDGMFVDLGFLRQVEERFK